MKRLRPLPVRFWLTVCVLAALLRPVSALAADPLSIHAQLVWATNDRTTNHPPIDEGLAKKLRATYRWTNYYQITEKFVTVKLKEPPQMVDISQHCKLQIGNLGSNWVEVKLFGKGNQVSTHKEKLSVNWPLILAGNATNDTAWFVVLEKLKNNLTKTGVTPIPPMAPLAPLAPLAPPAPLAPAAPVVGPPPN